MKLKLILSIFILLFCVSHTIAQQTSYEKKIAEITQKYFSICYYGYNKQLTLVEKAELQMYTDGDEARKFILGLGIINYAMNHTEVEVKNLLAQMDKELKAAEKLKTSIDFQREKDRIALAAQAAYEKTDAGSIKKNIKANFELWNQKGEFEKQADYEERLQKQSQNSFTKKCIEQIKNKLRNYHDYYALSKELLPYNADNEFFIVKFKINGIEWQNKLNIPIANAEVFKSNWSNLRSEINDYDWCFVDDTLCPTLITLSDRTSKYKFTLPLQNQKEISYSFDDLGIDNSYLKGFVFKYSDAKAIDLKIAYEKFVKDSLEIVSYNNKLEAAYQNYNSQLLANPHNIEKTIISNYQKILNSEDIEDNYKNSLNSLNRSYEKIENEIERDFNQAYYSAEQLFPIKEDFERYYTQGKSAFQAEILKRQEKQEEERILNYLKIYSQFIESMDFQKEKKESLGSTMGKRLLNATAGTTISENDYTKENELRENILSIINDNRNKSYYAQVLDFTFATNKDLNKEWTKNGAYFSNKAELYDAYISGSYKQIINNKK